MEREKIANHVANDCGYTVITCKYENIGCEVKLKRHDMMEHEKGDDANHLHMALDNITVLKSTVENLEEKSSTLKHGESMTLKLKDFELKRQNNEVFKSQPFYTSTNGYRMSIHVHSNGFGYAKGTHVSIFASFLQGQYDSEMNWPFAGSITVQLLNQLADENHYTRRINPKVQQRDVDKAGTLPRGCAKYIGHSELYHDSVKKTQYLKEDTLYFKVSVQEADPKPWLE